MERNTQIPFLILLGLTTVIFFFLFIPFFFSIFWAAVLAGIFKPLYQIMRKRLSPTLAAGVVVVLILLIIIMPAGMIAGLLIAESLQIYNSLTSDEGQIEQTIRSSLKLSEISLYLSRLGVEETLLLEKFTEALKAIANYILVQLTALTQNTLSFVVKFLVMLYSLFYFLRDSDRLLQSLIRYYPLGGGREKMLYSHFLAAANTSIKATLIIGGIQGLLGGLIFWVTGIRGALLWGLIMTIASLIPVVGSSIVWVPAAIVMLIGGHIWEGVTIVVFCALVIGLIDNLLRPIIIGKDVQIHPLIIFLSTLGGIFVFGFSGFILGPIISALFVAAWDIFDQSYSRDG